MSKNQKFTFNPTNTFYAVILVYPNGTFVATDMLYSTYEKAFNFGQEMIAKMTAAGYYAPSKAEIKDMHYWQDNWKFNNLK